MKVRQYYVIEVRGRLYRFASYEAAARRAEEVYARTGVIVGIHLET